MADSVQPDYLTGCVAFRAEMLAPHSIRENDHGRGAGVFIGRLKVAPEDRLNFEDPEQVRRRWARFDLNWILGPRLKYTGVAVEGRGYQRDVLQVRHIGPQVGKLGEGQFADKLIVKLQIGLPDHVDAALIGERKRVQKDRLNQRKHGDAESDADGQDHSRPHVGSVAAGERTQRKSGVLNDHFGSRPVYSRARYHETRGPLRRRHPALH